MLYSSAQLREEKLSHRRPFSSIRYQVVALLIVVFAVFYEVLGRLIGQWWGDANWSHGFLVPIFAGYVVWRERGRLRAIPVRPSWWGLPILVAAMGTLILGVLGAENFLSRTSFLFALAGLVVLFGGWRLFRGLLFPWAVLFLMIPLPVIVFNQIALPLQFLAARLGASLLDLAGVPVLREGNVINLPALSLDVVEACSGLRSLMSLITIGVFYGYVVEPRIMRRTLLILAAIPIAVLANGLRIMGSGLLGEYWSPEKAEGFLHTFSGVVIFLISVGLLMLLHTILSWGERRARLRAAA